MDKNVVVSFEKVNGAHVKGTIKARRRNVPGRVEREEIIRATAIETDIYLHSLMEKNFWYPIMD